MAFAVRAWGDAGRPYARVYEDPQWRAAEAVTGWSTYHSPDLAWANSSGANRWAVAMLVNDYREAFGPDLVVAERVEGATTWNESARLDVNLRTPWASITHDPMSGQWIVAHLDNVDFKVVVRVLAPGSLTWQSSAIFGDGWSFYRGLDIACSERNNTATGANCLIVAVGNPTDMNGNLVPGPGRVVNLWFRVAGVVPSLEALDPGSYPLRADLPPQLAANPVAGANPQFLVSYTRSIAPDDWRHAHHRVLSDAQPFWGAWLSAYSAASADRQYLPFSLGTHIFGGMSYLDLHYSLDN